MKISYDLNIIVLPTLRAEAKNNGCWGCYFEQANGNTTSLAPLPCLERMCEASSRDDEREVIFVEI